MQKGAPFRVPEHPLNTHATRGSAEVRGSIAGFSCQNAVKWVVVGFAHRSWVTLDWLSGGRGVMLEGNVSNPVANQLAEHRPHPPFVRSFVQKHPARGLWNAKAARLCKWGLSSLPRGLTSLAVTRYRHGALLSYTRTAYGHSSALEYRRTRTKHCPKGPDTKGGLWGSWPLELRCAMAVFGNPEGCGNELGKPSLGGDSRRIMHPNQGRYPGVGAPIMGG